MGTYGSFRRSAKLIICVSLAVKLRKVEITHALPHMVSWFGTEEKDFKCIIVIIIT